MNENFTSFLTFQIKKLEWHIDNSYPDMELSRLDLKRLKNFILMFLSLKPEARPSAESAKNHKFLCSGVFMPKPDAAWKKKGKMSIPLFCIINNFSFCNIKYACFSSHIHFINLSVFCASYVCTETSVDVANLIRYLNNHLKQICKDSNFIKERV